MSTGIENAAYNLWNTNIVDLTHDNIDYGPVRVPEHQHGRRQWRDRPRERGVQAMGRSADDAPNPTGVKIELLGDSAERRAGGTLARGHRQQSGPARHAQAEHIPLAYQNSDLPRPDYRTRTARYLCPIQLLATMSRASTLTSGPARSWSSPRRTVWVATSSPMTTSRRWTRMAKISRNVSTNERLVVSKEEIDATLVAGGLLHGCAAPTTSSSSSSRNNSLTV